MTAHLLDTDGKKIGVTGLPDTVAVVSVMPIKTWERIGFTREDLIPTNLRLAAAIDKNSNNSPPQVGRNLWFSAGEPVRFGSVYLGA